MAVESIISILVASAAAFGALYTTIFQRRELRGKTKAEQDAISTKASNDALAIIQGGLGKELERVSKELEEVREEYRALRGELDSTLSTLRAATTARDLAIREKALLQSEIDELRRRVVELETRP